MSLVCGQARPAHFARQYSSKVKTDDDNDALYLLVTADLGEKVELRFCVGGEGHGWAEAYEDNFVIVDCIGFDEMYWDYVERTIGPPRNVVVAKKPAKPAKKATKKPAKSMTRRK